MEFTDDPFRDYRYEDPFNIADPFAEDNTPQTITTNANKQQNNNLDPFGMSLTGFGFESSTSRSKSTEPWERMNNQNVGGRASAPLANAISEDKQLAWAAQESLRIQEQERQRQMQEQRDLELAIALSKREQQTGR